MPEWKRTTREVPFEGLLPEMVAAIHKHIEQYHLGPIRADVLVCIQTDSHKEKKGLFGSAETVHLGAVVTPRWLVWAIDDTQSSVSAHSAQLLNLTVQDYAETPFAKMVADSGVQVSGMFTDATESASAFLGLEENRAGQKFRQTLINAAQEAKK